jgi:hypothetical protein
MAAALLAADPAAQGLPEVLFAGAHPGAVGLRVHRNTVLGALSNALRSSFKSVERLVGEAFFDRMAVAYARANPPLAPTGRPRRGLPDSSMASRHGGAYLSCRTGGSKAAR